MVVPAPIIERDERHARLDEPPRQQRPLAQRVTTEGVADLVGLAVDLERPLGGFRSHEGQRLLAVFVGPLDWIAGGPTRARLPHAPPPEGTITLRGRIDIPARDYYELGDRKAPAGAIWEHLDPARFAQASGIPVLPIVVEAVDSPLDAGLVRDWPRPDVGIERHIGYMVQWYTFAVMAAGLWLWFTLRRRRAPSRP